jgi:flagellar motor switch protein FliM
LSLPSEDLFDGKRRNMRKSSTWNLACHTSVTVKRQLFPDDFDAAVRPYPIDGADIPAFDFRRPDHISKSQVRAIHLLHETFVRSLMSDLSAYLRTYIVMNLVSVEQVAYSEFLESLPPSTFVACLGMKPYEGSALLELNPCLVFPILEMLLGGTGKTYTNIKREVTEIEQHLMDGLIRIVIRNLSDAWKAVTAIDFTVQSVDTEPQFLQVMAPNEAVVSIGVEMRIGEASGLMNIAMPSLMIKMMRHKFDQQWSMRKTAATPDEERRVFRIVESSAVCVEAILPGAALTVKDVINLNAGQVLMFDHPVDKPLACTLNGQQHFSASIVQTGRKFGVRIAGDSRV